ncbi:MAG: 30S ribosome-binding factor RbfA [Candidatus Nanopelagicales bacterium]
MSHQERVRRLADRVKVITAEMLQLRTKDPRLGFVTITDVRVTNDLREANIFYTVLGSPEDQAGTAAALNAMKGRIRTEIGQQTGIKHTPALTFTADAVPENARHIDDLLAQAAAADAVVAAAAASAHYAGDPDPYRIADEGEDE